ncbi:glycosyltransferase [Patescibacteria group bacterium]|nr:glycosyltransferase [Patescibacteria group bacterium]
MVSILIPISNTENPKLIDRCLKSLAKQTYKDFEVLIVTSENSAQKISQITKKYPFIRILEKNLSKSAARNFAAKNAKGEYLYHLDTDMALTPRVLSECVKKAEKGVEAIIAPYEEASQVHFISRCRALEKRLLRGSRTVITPLFLKKSLFEKVGGYDEELDPMDDWSLHLALKKIGVESKSISAPVLLRETISFKKALKKKYEAGRIYPALKAKHHHPFQLNPRLRFEDYFRNWQELTKNPLITLGLFFLKAGDIFSFFWGTLHPITKPQNRYALTKVAEEYEQKRLGSNFGRYKHFAELNSLFKLLPKKDWQILEVGCGTGRITKELVKREYKVFPIDSSPAMLAQYRQKPGLPKPQLADTTQLSFLDNSFPIVLSLRVIWHLPKEDIAKMFSEVARVSSNLVILDITNKKRWPKIYLNLQQHTYFFTWEEFVDLCKDSNLKIEERIPLDTLAPFWLNFLPSKLAITLFPLIYKADLLLAKLIPPGRYLVKLSKL